MDSLNQHQAKKVSQSLLDITLVNNIVSLAVQVIPSSVQGNE
ncbi:MAG: hypothetical protein ACI9JO_001467, partial [Psychrobacter okhotskensis]